MNGLDTVIIFILTVSVIYSLFRGLVREVFSLLSIVLGFAAASRTYSLLSNFLHTWLSNKPGADILGFIIVFVATSMVISLMGRIIKGIVRASNLAFVDRITGAFFGILKGIFIATVIVLSLVAFLPPADPIVRNSRLSPYFVTLGNASLRFVPSEFGEMVRKKAEGFFQYREDSITIQRDLGVRDCSSMRRNNSFSFFRISFA